MQKFALPATKLRKNVKAPSAGCCDSLLFIVYNMVLKSILRGTVIRKYLY